MSKEVFVPVEMLLVGIECKLCKAMKQFYDKRMWLEYTKRKGNVVYPRKEYKCPECSKCDQGD